MLVSIILGSRGSFHSLLRETRKPFGVVSAVSESSEAGLSSLLFWLVVGIAVKNFWSETSGVYTSGECGERNIVLSLYLQPQ
jgi:hypothetical protein